MSELSEKTAEVKAIMEKYRGREPDQLARLHQEGKLTARERVEKLLDPATFYEVDLWYKAYKTGFDIDREEIPGDAVVTGYGRINGKPVYVWAQDPSVMGGTMAAIHLRKIAVLQEKALKEKIPIIGIYDSEGMRMEDLVQAHSHYTPGTIMYFQTLSSGVIPQISLVMGPCTGAMATSACLGDFVIMTKKTSYMCAAPPPEVSPQEYGSPDMHARKSGCCDILAADEEDCLKKCRELLSFFPQSCEQKPPIKETNDPPDRRAEDLLDIVPAQANKWFDMREVIKRVVDDGYYLEIKKDYARNLTVGLARLNGQSIGIIANNSIWRGGVEDVDTSGKHARILRCCDAFNIPIVYFSDCPAFLPSVEQEQRGILRHGAFVIQATCEATVPKINMIVRKLVGGATLVMPTNITKADAYPGWPIVDRSIVGAKGMTAIVYRGRMKRAKTPEEAQAIWDKGLEAMEEMLKEFSFSTNEDIIDPRDTRKYLIDALERLANKKQERPPRKHENTNL